MKGWKFLVLYVIALVIGGFVFWLDMPILLSSVLAVVSFFLWHKLFAKWFEEK